MAMCTANSLAPGNVSHTSESAGDLAVRCAAVRDEHLVAGHRSSLSAAWFALSLRRW